VAPVSPKRSGEAAGYRSIDLCVRSMAHALGPARKHVRERAWSNQCFWFEAGAFFLTMCRPIGASYCDVLRVLIYLLRVTMDLEPGARCRTRGKNMVARYCLGYALCWSSGCVWPMSSLEEEPAAGARAKGWSCCPCCRVECEYKYSHILNIDAHV
jgi:hypothetical protein